MKSLVVLVVSLIFLPSWLYPQAIKGWAKEGCQERNGGVDYNLGKGILYEGLCKDKNGEKYIFVTYFKHRYKTPEDDYSAAISTFGTFACPYDKDVDISEKGQKCIWTGRSCEKKVKNTMYENLVKKIDGVCVLTFLFVNGSDKRDAIPEEYLSCSARNLEEQK